MPKPGASPADGAHAPSGDLAHAIMRFAGVLRRAGLALGPGHALDAVAACRAVGLARREDVYWALHATLVSRHEQDAVFDQAFRAFWQGEAALRISGPLPAAPPAPSQPKLKRRVAEALADTRPKVLRAPPVVRDVPAWSAAEALRARDFESLSADEWRDAQALVRTLSLPVPAMPTRRDRPAAGGQRVLRRHSFRRQVRGVADLMPLVMGRPRTRVPPLVILCDISGSMERYARMLLLFFHAVANDRLRVHTFLFATRLTNVTRELKARDVDDALGRVGGHVQDWGGGTRIGHCLDRFNREWGRRVLGQGAVVLLVTDGLDRDDALLLGRAAQRLRLGCRRLIWLNPLLRFEGFQPLAEGVRALLPHVDDFRPVHSLDALADLGRALAANPARRGAPLMRAGAPQGDGRGTLRDRARAAPQPDGHDVPPHEGQGP
jgi:uncharacterized protein with von Willebrand factor type A (vWA) domain